MSLTKADLEAIKVVIEDVVDPKFEELEISTAQGFEEVHKKIDRVEKNLSGQIKNVNIRQVETLEFVRQHETRIKTLEEAVPTK
jgi:hypothetical protein